MSGQKLDAINPLGGHDGRRVRIIQLRLNVAELDGVPGVLIMVGGMICQGAVRPVNRLVQMPEPGRVDIRVGGLNGRRHQECKKTDSYQTALKLHYICCRWLQLKLRQTSRGRQDPAMGHTLLDFKTETTARTCGGDPGIVVVSMNDVTY
jgi:hypothetical protein